MGARQIFDGAVYLALSAIAIQLLFLNSEKNGLFEHGRAIKASSLLHDGTSLRRHYTGVGFVDGMLTTLVAFFWPLMDPKKPATSDQFNNYFTWQLLPLVVIQQIEGLRGRRPKSIVSATILWGILFQVASVAVTTPIYMFLLSMAPSNGPTPSRKLNAIIPAIIIGYIIPSYLMANKEKVTSSAWGQQALVAFWQPFPAYVTLIRVFLQSFSHTSLNRPVEKRRTLSRMRVVCGFAIAGALLGRAQMLFAAFSTPKPVDYLRQAILPNFNLPSSDLLGLSHQFLQCDYWVGAAAMSAFVFSQAGRHSSALFFQCLIALALLGPGGALAYFYYVKETRRIKLA